MSFLDMVGHTSFFLTALSFYVRDMLLLRVLAVVSGVVGIAYNFFIPVGPMWLAIFWLSVFLAINSIRIIGIFLDRRSIDFNEEEAELHETLFQNFSPVEFRKLMRIGEWCTAAAGEKLVVQGAEVEGLKLIYNGEVIIQRDDVEVGRARDGAMIGEVSFLQGGAANATVLTTNRCRYVDWSADELHKLLSRNPSMDIAMKHVFSIDLMRKLNP